MIHNSQQFFLEEMNFKSSIWQTIDMTSWILYPTSPIMDGVIQWHDRTSDTLPGPYLLFPMCISGEKKSCSKSLRFYFCLQWQKLLNSCMLIEVLHLLIETRQGKTCFSTLFMLANWLTRKIVFFPLLLLVIFITGFWHIIYTSFSRKCK
jgi:hypothetical protein